MSNVTLPPCALPNGVCASRKAVAFFRTVHGRGEASRREQ